MEIVFRCNKPYLKNKISHCGGGGPDGMEKFKTAVEFWNKTFNLDFFTIRKRMRRISYDILVKQPCITKVNILQSTKLSDNVYAPMDDDDIFIINNSELEECISNFNDDCNCIILGRYDVNFNHENKCGFNKNFPATYPMATNNFLFNYESSKNYCNENWRNAHNKVHEQPYVKYQEMRHIVTSMHIVHPCSITLLLPRYINHKENWVDTKDHRNLMEELIYEYVNETTYKNKLPNKFWSPFEEFKNLFSEVKFK